VQSWVNGKEGGEFVGVGARFGPKIVSKEKHANRTKLTLADPMDCCSPPKHKVGIIQLVMKVGNRIVMINLIF
jgi:signal peptide peptidase-like 2B